MLGRNIYRDVEELLALKCSLEACAELRRLDYVTEMCPLIEINGSNGSRIIENFIPSNLMAPE
jgi:hypothetical protein